MTPKSILFVCLGNICRSPAAEGVFRSYAEEANISDNITIDSAGTYGGHAGELPDPRMRRAAEARGYNLTSRSRQVTSDDFERFDVIIAMDDNNYYALQELAPTYKCKDKIWRFAELFTRHKIDHVPDPYYEGADGFEYVLDLLEDGCSHLANMIK